MKEVIQFVILLGIAMLILLKFRRKGEEKERQIEAEKRRKEKAYVKWVNDLIEADDRRQEELEDDDL